MSKAKQLADAIHARLTAITVANGYLTDIGSRVFRGRTALDESHLPCIVMVEGDDNIEDQAVRKVKVAQQFIIEGHDECDFDNPNDKAHDIISDMKRAIFKGDRTFGGLVVSDKNGLRYEGRNISPRPDGAAIVAASIRFVCVFVEDLDNP